MKLPIGPNLFKYVNNTDSGGKSYKKNQKLNQFPETFDLFEIK